MAIDTSTSPYFDDYDVNKNYTKILYKPGLALQARELNQTQSILQNQIKTLADTLFADGDSVSGLETSKPTTNTNFRSIKLKNTFNNVSIDVNNFLGKYVTCQSSVDEFLSYQDYLSNLISQGYDITLSEITTIADYFSGAELLYTIDSINYYKLYRKPRVSELTYWINRYIYTYNKIIGAAFKQEFILKITADNYLSDSERILNQSKEFLSGASNNSVFYLTTFVPYKLIGEVVEVYPENTPTLGDPPTLIIKTITSFVDKSFPSGDTLLFYDSQDNAINKITTNLKATTQDDVTFTVTGSLLASEPLLTLESPSLDVKIGDYLTHPILNEKLYITKIISSVSYHLSSLPKFDITSDRITISRKNTVPTLRVTIGAGIYYKAGYMIRCVEQSIVPEKYSAWPFKSVGLDLVEEIITSNNDSSLLDPALESSNYLAVGADRLKLSLVLNAYDIVDNKPDVNINYKELKRFYNGVEDPFETKNENTFIRKELAERTYDESGNYVVDTIKFKTLPSSPFSKYFDIQLSPINSYIGGYNVKTSSPLVIPIEKETSTESLETYNINTTTGNYIIIEAPSKGLIDTNTLKQSNIFVELHSSYNVSSSTRLGDAAIKSVEYLSGLGENTLFKLSFYVTVADEGKDLLNTKHIIATKNFLTYTTITTWSQWTATYGYSETDGRAVASALYQSSSLLGTYNSKTFYGLFRDPDAEGLAYWVGRYINTYNRLITTALKNEFISALDSTPSSSDYTRSLLSTKDFYYAPTGSIFLTGTSVSDYTSANIYFRANVASSGISNNKVTIFDPNPFDSLIFNTKQINTKTTTNINFESIRVIKGATFSSGVYTKTFGSSSSETFPFGDGNIPRTTAATKVQIIVVSGSTANTSLGIFNFTNKGTVTVASSSKSMTIDLADSSFNGKADIQFYVDVENISPRQKTRINNANALVTFSEADVLISLQKADIALFKGVFRIGSNTWTGDYNISSNYYTGNVVLKDGLVYVANTNSVGRDLSDIRYWHKIQADNTLLYNFDNGQRDTYYDHGYISFVGNPNKLPGRCLVIFDYYNHSGEGPITADSYPSIFNIDPYRSPVSSRYYDLRNSLDFRPRRLDDVIKHDYSPFLKPVMSSLTECNITYYVNRIDKIYLTNRAQNVDGTNIKLKREKGIPSKNPIAPNRSPNPLVEMLIGTVFVPAFTATERTVVIVPENITRKTMRDMNIISQRLSSVEKTIKLQQLDIIALKAKVFDDGGDELLKTGIFIDDFSNSNKLNTGLSTLGIAIDSVNKICMPAISSFNFRVTAENTQNISIQDNISQMKYTEEEFTSQKNVTITTTTTDDGEISVNPGGTTNAGRVTLFPNGSMALKLGPLGAVKTASSTPAAGTPNSTPDVIVAQVEKKNVPDSTSTTTSEKSGDESGKSESGDGVTKVSNGTAVVESGILVKIVEAVEGEELDDPLAGLIAGLLNQTEEAEVASTLGAVDANGAHDAFSYNNGSNGNLNNGENLNGELLPKTRSLGNNGVNSEDLAEYFDSTAKDPIVQAVDNITGEGLEQTDGGEIIRIDVWGTADDDPDTGDAEKTVNDVISSLNYIDGVAEINIGGENSAIVYEQGSIDTNPSYVVALSTTEKISSDGTTNQFGTGDIGAYSSSGPTVSTDDLIQLTSSVPSNDTFTTAIEEGAINANGDAVTIAMGGVVNDGYGNSSPNDPFSRATWQETGYGIGGGGSGGSLLEQFNIV